LIGTFKSSISMGLTASYEKRSGETLQPGESRPRNPTDNDRLSLNATGQYGFSSNITGNLLLGFSQDRDLVREIIRRQIRVELRGSFNF
jgi:hypothetical protein